MTTAPNRIYGRNQIPTPTAGGPVLDWATHIHRIVGRKDARIGTMARPDVDAFAWSVVDDSGTAKIKIGAGTVCDTMYGATTAVHVAAEVTNIVLSSGYNVIYLLYTIGSSAATQTSVSTDTTEAAALSGVPANTETQIYYPLHCIRDHQVNTPSQNNVRIFTHIRDYTSGIRADLFETDGTRDTTLDVTGEGTETADTDTWDIEAQDASKHGVTLSVTTRVVYDDTSDETLYGFYRTLTFDGAGRLVAISAETRYTVDAPVVC